MCKTVIIFLLSPWYIRHGSYDEKADMKKSKWQLEQDAPMDKYDVRMTAAHARHARRRGSGNLARGVRKLIEEDAGIPDEERPGPADRWKKK